MKRNGKQLIVRQRETASNLPKKHELCSYFKQLNKLRTGTTINTWWEKQAIWMGKWIKRIQSYHKDTVRLWQTDSFRTRKKERRTVGIRVLLLILVSEGPQARPLKSSATVLSFTMSYSQFLFPSTSPFSNYVPLSLSLSSFIPKAPFFSPGTGWCSDKLEEKKETTVECEMSSYFFPYKKSLSFYSDSSHGNPSKFIYFESWWPSQK